MGNTGSWFEEIEKRLSELFGQPLPPPAPQPPPQPPLDDSLKTLSPRVLVLIFDPLIDPASGMRLTQSRYANGWSRVDDLIAGYSADVEACSGGLVKYREVERQIVDGFPLRDSGQRYDAPAFLKILDHQAPVNEQDLCNYPALIDQFNLSARVDNDEFDEVWMFGFPFAGFSESRMVGQGAFFVNGAPLARPGRRFVVMGFNYQRGVGEMLEDLGHRAEFTMAQVFGSLNFLVWAYNRNRTPAQLDPAKFAGLNLFERFILFNQIAPGRANVGLLHYAPNSTTDYEWGNAAPVLSCADDWLLFPKLPDPPNYRTMTCADWGNGDIRAHHKWWLGRMPQVAGHTNGVLNNWWQYVAQCDSSLLDHLPPQR
jgi:hypothetical protein